MVKNVDVFCFFAQKQMGGGFVFVYEDVYYSVEFVYSCIIDLSLYTYISSYYVKWYIVHVYCIGFCCDMCMQICKL